MVFFLTKMNEKMVFFFDKSNVIFQKVIEQPTMSRQGTAKIMRHENQKQLFPPPPPNSNLFSKKLLVFSAIYEEKSFLFFSAYHDVWKSAFSCASIFFFCVCCNCVCFAMGFALGCRIKKKNAIRREKTQSFKIRLKKDSNLGGQGGEIFFFMLHNFGGTQYYLLFSDINVL